MEFLQIDLVLGQQMVLGGSQQARLAVVSLNACADGHHMKPPVQPTVCTARDKNVREMGNRLLVGAAGDR
jgi:hypothetical protein